MLLEASAFGLHGIRELALHHNENCVCKLDI